VAHNYKKKNTTTHFRVFPFALLIAICFHTAVQYTIITKHNTMKSQNVSCEEYNFRGATYSSALHSNTLHFDSFPVVCQMVSELFRKVQDAYIQQRELGCRGKGLRQQPSTAASHFLKSLTELTTRLERYRRHTESRPRVSANRVNGYGCGLRRTWGSVHVMERNMRTSTIAGVFYRRPHIIRGRRAQIRTFHGCISIISRAMAGGFRPNRS